MNREVVLSPAVTLLFLAVIAGILLGALLHTWWVERRSARAGEEPRPRDPISFRLAEGAVVDACSDAASTAGTRTTQVRATHLRCGDVIECYYGELVSAVVLTVDFGVDADGWHNVHVVARTPTGRLEHRWFDADAYVTVERAEVPA
ncbi:MAG TPA: hypothetical protein VGK49_00765 [Ilumatobacteraceae bacterium]